jgi:hypothetical protein
VTAAERRTVLAAFAGGAICGALVPVWQAAVEPAQVLAGLVRYPEGNPTLIYEANTWTVLHQVVALALRAGVSEAVASIVVSAVVPGLIFSAIAVWVMAVVPESDVSGLVLTALTPFLAFSIQEVGVRYPVLIAGHPHTYGMLGLGMAMLGAGLLAVGAWAPAGFAHAFSTPKHASLGFWTGVTSLLAWPWRDRALSGPTWRALRGAALGAAFAAISLAVHFGVSFRALPLAADERRVYLETFVRMWDDHRAPVQPLDWAVLLAVVTGLAAAARVLGGSAAPSERILARFCTAVMVLGLVTTFAARPDAGLPGLLLTFMPSRFLNVLVLGSLPLAVGWLWSSGVAGRLALAALSGALWLDHEERANTPRLMAASLGLGIALRATSWRAAGSVALAVIALFAYAAGAQAAGFPIDDEAALWLRVAPAFAALALLRAGLAQRSEGGLSPRLLARAASVVCLATVADVAGGWIYVRSRHTEVRYGDMVTPPSDAALASMAQGHGMVALGPDFFLIQLLTRRPVLLETGAVDFLPYVPEAGPELVRILRVLYGTDYFRSTGHGLLIEPEHVSAVWTARSDPEWRALARELGFRDVLVSAGWTLALPEVARSEQYVLYRVPD